MKTLLPLVQGWIAQFGYFSAVPALFLDATGVPWPWVVLCLLAGSAGLNVTVLIAVGFVLLSAWDHAFYWLGALGKRHALPKLEAKFPPIGDAAHAASQAVQTRGVTTLLFGRFLPVIGRVIGLGAGLSGMNYLRFIILDALGCALVSVGFGAAASLLGRQFVDDPRFALALNVVIGGFVAFLLFSGARYGLQKMHARDAKRRAEITET